MSWRICTAEQAGREALTEIQLGGGFMKAKSTVALALVLTLTAVIAGAQPAPYNDVGVTMGHWHLISEDVEANKALFLAMGAELYMPGQPVMRFPGLYINLRLGTETGEGGSEGSVINHVGFIVDNVQERVAEWTAKGVEVIPGNNGRQDQAFIETQEGVRIEILEDRNQSVPIRGEHVHLVVPESEVEAAQAWYARVFGGTPGTRNNAPVVDLPGVQMRFRGADVAQAPTRGRILDHIGFDVRDHAAFMQRLEAEGITLDEPVRTGSSGNVLTYITDPWGTRVEIIQRGPLGPRVQ